MGAERLKTFENTFQSIELVAELELGQNKVVRERLVRHDDSPVLITTIFASENSRANLLIDSRFIERPIITEPGGLLIDQKATTQSWGSGAGLKPEYLLDNPAIPDNSIGICPTNFGWQRGAFMVRDGSPILLPNDKENLTGNFETIGFDGQSWSAYQIAFENGKPTSEARKSVGAIHVGFSVPLIIKNAEIVPLTIWERGDPRALADPRNWVDLACGKKVSSDFWLLIRKFLPGTPAAARRVTQEGRMAVVRADGINPQDVQKLKQIINESGLENNWKIFEETNERPARAAIYAMLPPNRLPAVGIGFGQDGKLIVTVVDGRQQDSTGATIDELAQIMKGKGAIYAGFGAAGGDVCVLAKTKEGTKILNSPSNLAGGERVTRLSPSLLVVSSS